jgi:hypothetical protein
MTGSQINIDQNSIASWEKPLAVLSAGIGFVFNASGNICDKPLLKWPFFALLLFSFSIAVHITYRKFKGRWGQLVYWLIGWVLLYFFLSVYVFTKQCPVANIQAPKKDTIIVKNENPPSNTTIDNSNSNNTYQKLPQRKLVASDVKRLKESLPEKNARVLVAYLKTSLEDTLLVKQIIDTLNGLGYSDVRETPTGHYDKIAINEKISIHQQISDEKIIYKVIINPQQ